MDKNKTLVLVTSSFPMTDSPEYAMIQPEIAPLAERFEKVIIIPAEFDSSHPAAPLPANVEVVTDLAPLSTARASRLRYMLHPMVDGAAADAAIRGCNPLRGAAFAAKALQWKKGLEQLIAARGLDLSTTLFYTFRLDYPSTALGLLADERNFKVVSRVHITELLHMQSPMMRRLTIGNIARLYATNDFAATTLRRNYPDEAGRITTRPLGSQKASRELLGPVPEEDSRELRFISVAHIEPYKRVDRVLDLVKEVARRLPGYTIHWTHAGAGSAMVELSRKLAKRLPPNLTVTLAGDVPNSEVHRILTDEPFDWCVMLAKSDGLPVSLCEGASYGVPAIAPATETIGSLVDSSTGIPASTEPDIREIADRIVDYTANRASYLALREAIFRRWEEHFAAERLRADFAAELAAL